jgi:hypothetical protein
MSTCNFPTGGAAPLITPESSDREWKEKGGNRTPLADCEVNCRSPVGYEFKWSRIFEERTDATEFAESNDSTPASICWNFVLVYPQDEFLDVGANLGGVADIALAILKRVREDLRTELSANRGSSALPPFIEFGGENNVSAFGLAVHGTEDIDHARQWVDRFIVAAVIPVLTERLEEENRASGLPRPRSSTRRLGSAAPMPSEISCAGHS